MSGILGDLQLFAQTILYYLIILFGMICSICVGLTVVGTFTHLYIFPTNPLVSLLVSVHLYSQACWTQELSKPYIVNKPILPHTNVNFRILSWPSDFSRSSHATSVGHSRRIWDSFHTKVPIHQRQDNGKCFSKVVATVILTTRQPI